MLNEEQFPLKEETFQILGACFEVYNELGCGFLESVYQESLGLELASLGIPFKAHPRVQVQFKDATLEATFAPDFMCFASVIVEIKAVVGLVNEHRAQVLNYLKASGIEVGLLVNFGHYPGLQYERIVRQRPHLRSSASSAV
jgi:GxxExxY protein